MVPPYAHAPTSGNKVTIDLTEETTARPQSAGSTTSTSLPFDSTNLQIRLGDGRLGTYEQLPQATKIAVRNEVMSWDAGDAANCLEKLRKRPPKGKQAKCVHARFHNSGNTLWSVDGPGSYACLTCTNKSRPCLVYGAGNIILLPLIVEARMGFEEASPKEAGYWVSLISARLSPSLHAACAFNAC